MDDHPTPPEALDDAAAAPASPAPAPTFDAPAPAPGVAAARMRDRSRLVFLLVGGWLLLAVLLTGFAILAFGITTFADVLAPCTEPPCAPVQPVDPMFVVGLIGVALVAGFLGFGLSLAPTRRALAVSAVVAATLCVASLGWVAVSGELLALAPTVLALPIAVVSGLTWAMTDRPSTT